jgi:hypothetical protein
LQIARFSLYSASIAVSAGGVFSALGRHQIPKERYCFLAA